MDPELSRRIYDNMFVFADLVQVDDRSVRTLLREIDPKLLVAGLKGVSQPVHDKIMRNISQRAAESLREEMEARGPARVAEIEAAQKEVLSIAKRLEAEGKIVLRSEQQDLVA
jgi:flagellar motor switch protein FliG